MQFLYCATAIIIAVDEPVGEYSTKRRDSARLEMDKRI